MIAAKFLHILGFTIWVGGMFFAYMILRPIAAVRLEPPLRLPLWEGVLGKFFFWVWLSIALVLPSGLYMMAQLGNMPIYVAAMLGLATSMMVIFTYVFLIPYGRLKRAVAAQDWKTGGAALAQIRQLVGVNLCLGLATMAAGTLGKLIA